MLITENQLDEWVRGNARDAQGVIVELTWRLVAASSARPKERRFPLGDSIGQPGPDGVLDVDYPFDPFVPIGTLVLGDRHRYRRRHQGHIRLQRTRCRNA